MVQGALNKAGFIIFSTSKKGELEFLSLAVRHSVTQKYHYDFPKGKMEPGESPLESAVREVAEEVKSDKRTELRIVEGFNHTTKYTNTRGQLIKIRWFVGFLAPKSTKGLRTSSVHLPKTFGVPEKTLRPSAEHERITLVPYHKAKSTFLKERFEAVTAAKRFLQTKGFTASRTNQKRAIYQRTRTIAGKKYRTYHSRRI